MHDAQTFTYSPCQAEETFAYSLSQAEDGWRWRIYDRDGMTVADGAGPSRAAAEAAVKLKLGGSDEEPRRLP